MIQMHNAEAVASAGQRLFGEVVPSVRPKLEAACPVAQSELDTMLRSGAKTWLAALRVLSRGRGGGTPHASDGAELTEQERELRSLAYTLTGDRYQRCLQALGYDLGQHIDPIDKPALIDTMRTAIAEQRRWEQATATAEDKADARRWVRDIASLCTRNRRG